MRGAPGTDGGQHQGPKGENSDRFHGSTQRIGVWIEDTPPGHNPGQQGGDAEVLGDPVEMMNGEITVEDEPDVGTTVMQSLQLAAPKN